MHKKTYNVLGIMSGTSLDGIDMAHVQFEVADTKWNYEILEAETVSYAKDWVNILQNSVTYNNHQLEELNRNYTRHLAGIIIYFIEKYNIRNLAAVCSHGHTVLHQPQRGVTLQIGNLPELAYLTGQKTVCDFRVQDVALGGQGAPLVPIGDRLLFSDYDFCLNLGGFSNISFEQNNKRIAFDISPVNTVLNYYARLLGKDYDNNGDFSRSGRINPELLNELNSIKYYQKNFPKSLGVEFVREIILPLIESYGISEADKLRTFTEHIAIQTAKALPYKKGKLLITGGGTYNNFLIERMREQLIETELIIPDRKTIDYKEALIFALLGVLKLRNEINVLSSVTGASHDHCSGQIYPAS